MVMQPVHNLERVMRQYSDKILCDFCFNTKITSTAQKLYSLQITRSCQQLLDLVPAVRCYECETVIPFVRREVCQVMNPGGQIFASLHSTPTVTELQAVSPLDLTNPAVIFNHNEQIIRQARDAISNGTVATATAYANNIFYSGSQATAGRNNKISKTLINSRLAQNNSPLSVRNNLRRPRSINIGQLCRQASGMSRSPELGNEMQPRINGGGSSSSLLPFPQREQSPFHGASFMEVLQHVYAPSARFANEPPPASPEFHERGGAAGSNMERQNWLNLMLEEKRQAAARINNPEQRQNLLNIIRNLQ